jgi:serine/threonine-protein kinase HipA
MILQSIASGEFGNKERRPDASTQRDARLAPAYDIVNTTAYIPGGVLALDLVGNKSLSASRQGLLEFARVCDVARPEEVIRKLLRSVEEVLARSTELCEQAPNVVVAIKQCAEPFIKTFA